MPKTLLQALLVALALALLVAPAAAKPSKQDVALAKKAAQEGKKHEKKGDWEEAREAWQKAVDLNDTPDARTHLAKAEAKLGHLLLAEEILKKALEQKKVSWAVQHKAKKQLKELDKQIPQLKVEPPASFTGKIYVNDEETDPSSLAEPLRLDPGEHKVRAEAEGYKPFSESVVLEEGDRKDLVILMTELPKPVAAPAPTPVKEEKASGSTQRTLGWVSIAIGGVGLGVGTVFGMQARSTRQELDGNCLNDVCTERDRELYDKGKNQANIATAGFIVGGVGIGLGTVLLLTASEDDEAGDAKADEARVEPVIGPAHVGVRGVF